MMTDNKLTERAAQLEENAVSIMRRAERIWGWTSRSKAISIAIGDTSRSLLIVAAALRARAQQEDEK